MAGSLDGRETLPTTGKASNEILPPGDDARHLGPRYSPMDGGDNSAMLRGCNLSSRPYIVTENITLDSDNANPTNLLSALYIQRPHRRAILSQLASALPERFETATKGTLASTDLA